METEHQCASSSNNILGSLPTRWHFDFHNKHLQVPERHPNYQANLAAYSAFVVDKVMTY